MPTLTTAIESQPPYDTPQRVHPKKLDDTFFLGLRNTLTEKSLLRTAKLADQVPLSDRLGTFKTVEHYLSTLNIFLASTNETRRCGLFLVRSALSWLYQKNEMLDIGIGNGILTNWLSAYFKHVTIVDNNISFIDNCKHKPKAKKMTAIYSPIESTQLKSNHYDFIHLGHVLYYIKRDKWLDLIKRLYKSLQPGGILAIVLSGDHGGKAQLLEHFGGKNFGVFNFTDSIESTFRSKVRLFYSDEYFMTKTLRGMLHTAGMLLNDQERIVKKDVLEDYLLSHVNRCDENYQLTSRQHYILIHKDV